MSSLLSVGITELLPPDYPITGEGCKPFCQDHFQ